VQASCKGKKEMRKPKQLFIKQFFIKYNINVFF